MDDLPGRGAAAVGGGRVGPAHLVLGAGSGGRRGLFAGHKLHSVPSRVSAAAAGHPTPGSAAGVVSAGPQCGDPGGAWLAAAAGGVAAAADTALRRYAHPAAIGADRGRDLAGADGAGSGTRG